MCALGMEVVTFKTIKIMFALFLSNVTKVIRRLRERGEPIRLFGESDEEACQRLRLPFELSFP